MNALKNFEAAFIVTIALLLGADYALQPGVQTQPAAQGMQVVVVTAKRLTNEQKQQMLIEENRTTLAAGAATSSKI